MKCKEKDMIEGVEAFNNISRVLAITRYDIEQRQAINDLSLNIHGENWFRDIFNYVYGFELVNANFETMNAPSVDLVDKTKKIAYQITTTRDKEKVIESFEKFEKSDFKDFELRFFYLLEKASFYKKTVDEIRNSFGVDITQRVFDYNDLLLEVNNLEYEKKIELDKKFFRKQGGTYTEHVVLDLVFKHILRDVKNVFVPPYGEWGLIDTKEKLPINEVNEWFAARIKDGNEFHNVIEGCNEENTLSALRKYVVDGLYKDTLMATGREVIGSSKITDWSEKSIKEILVILRKNDKFNFNNVLQGVHKKLAQDIDVHDFNSMNVLWAIIAYFFEICDIGESDADANKSN